MLREGGTITQNNENSKLTIPYIVYESMLDKEDRQQRRLVYVIILLIALLVVSNVIWLVAWNQYDYVDDYTEIDSGNGVVSYIGEDGNISYAESSTQETDKDS